MTTSKWNYIAAGVAAAFTFIGAIGHSLGLVIFNFLFVVWNWYVAEHKKHLEEVAMLTEYKAYLRTCEDALAEIAKTNNDKEDKTND